MGKFLPRPFGFCRKFQLITREFDYETMGRQSEQEIGATPPPLDEAYRDAIWGTSAPATVTNVAIL